jgi:hypothetical protein
MCDPLILTAAVSAVQYIGGKAAAEAQYDATEKQTLLQYQQIGEKQGQINDQSALEQSERIKHGMVERGKIATIAGESGALGLSSDRLLADSFMQEGTDISSLEKNRQNAIAQTGWESKQAQARGQSANAETASREPSIIGTGLQIGADVWTANNRAKAKAKQKTDIQT